MSGCRYACTSVVSFLQVLVINLKCYKNKPFGVHEKFMTDKVKVKYVSIILISCQQTKPLGKPNRYVKLLMARTNYKGWHSLLCIMFYRQHSEHL